VIVAEGVGLLRDDTPIKAKGAQQQEAPAAAAGENASAE
jgi:hypothetical protein